jgi:hypothetical protein
VLESIKATTAAEPYRLSTKLTGAGGGGCAVTLVPDGAYEESFSQRSSDLIPSSPPDFKAQDLQDLISGLIREGFEPYLTSVGGSGLGILPPYSHRRNRRSAALRPAQDLGQMTPPETPIPDESLLPESSNTEYTSELEPLRPSFETSSSSELTPWADGLGRWLYV